VPLSGRRLLLLSLLLLTGRLLLLTGRQLALLSLLPSPCAAAPCVPTAYSSTLACVPSCTLSCLLHVDGRGSGGGL